jgi:hypothetical protein
VVLPADISAIASQALVRQLGCRTREGVFRESAERNRWRDCVHRGLKINVFARAGTLEHCLR